MAVTDTIFCDTKFKKSSSISPFKLTPYKHLASSCKWQWSSYNSVVIVLFKCFLSYSYIHLFDLQANCLLCWPVRSHEERTLWWCHRQMKLWKQRLTIHPSSALFLVETLVSDLFSSTSPEPLKTCHNSEFSLCCLLVRLVCWHFQLVHSSAEVLVEGEMKDSWPD